jgi:hypothetical protein
MFPKIFTLSEVYALNDLGGKCFPFIERISEGDILRCKIGHPAELRGEVLKSL